MIQMKVSSPFFIIIKKNFNFNFQIEIDPSRVIQLCFCIAKGIEKIHQVGIAHRDLKTKNVTSLLKYLNHLLLSINNELNEIDFN